MTECRCEVTKIEKLTDKAREKELKITLVSDDIRFFFNLARRNQLNILEGDNVEKELNTSQQRVIDK